MSGKRGLGKLYDRLTPEERFTLDVEVMARGDEKESRRLVDACPRHNYRMTDLAFSGRSQTTLVLVLAERRRTWMATRPEAATPGATPGSARACAAILRAGSRSRTTSRRG